MRGKPVHHETESGGLTVPNNGYLPAHEPPTLSDRILARPWALITSILAIWGGPRFIIDALAAERISASIGHAPPASELLLGVALTVGGVLAIWSVIAPEEALSKRWRRTCETGGLLALSLTYVAYGIGLSLFPGVYGGAAAAVTLGLGLAAGLRTVSLIITERRIKIIAEAEEK